MSSFWAILFICAFLVAQSCYKVIYFITLFENKLLMNLLPGCFQFCFINVCSYHFSCFQLFFGLLYYSFFEIFKVSI